jgi:hypothetical protein
MNRPTRLASAIVFSAILSPCAIAQVPSTPDIRASNTVPQARVSVASTDPDAVARPRPAAKRRHTLADSRLSYGYDTVETDDSHAGFRNPNGVGRKLEWYPAGNRFQNDRTGIPFQAARFNGSENASPTFSESVAGQAVGAAKYNALQSHIDNYARPYFGFGGLGAGYFGGFY